MFTKKMVAATLAASMAFSASYVGVVNLSNLKVSAEVGGTGTIYGDANCDGVVNAFDLIAAKRNISNPLTEQGRINVDFNGNGVDVSDVVQLKKYLLGELDTLSGPTGEYTGEYTIPELSMESKNIPNLDSFKFIAEMGAGINLGNTFDAISNSAPVGEANLNLETSWCGVRTTREIIDSIKNQGYKTIRIPVSWHNHVDEDFNINAEWLNRVQEVIDYAIDNDMYVITNIHHDNEYDYMYPSYDYLENSKEYVGKVWTQVAEKFKDYDEHLIFETLNEPRLQYTSFEWVYSSASDECREAADCINQYNQTALDAIRAVGGENANRYVMVPGYAGKMEAAMANEFKLPEDSATDKLLLSVHAYIPYNYAMSAPGATGSATEFTATDQAEIDNVMETMYIMFVSKNIPVVIGEYGARNKNIDGNDYTQGRVDYAANYVASARTRGISCVWWDNNAFESKSGEAFGLLHRATNKWTFDAVAYATVKYGDGSKTKFVAPWYEGSSSGSGATILPDGTIMFPTEIGEEITLGVELDNGVAQLGGALTFSVSLYGTNYWVAYQWEATSSGNLVIDMTVPNMAINSSIPDDGTGSNAVTDEAVLAEIGKLVMKGNTAAIQYWWACDSNWDNLESPFDQYGGIKSASAGK